MWPAGGLTIDLSDEEDIDDCAFFGFDSDEDTQFAEQAARMAQGLPPHTPTAVQDVRAAREPEGLTVNPPPAIKSNHSGAQRPGKNVVIKSRSKDNTAVHIASRRTQASFTVSATAASTAASTGRPGQFKPAERRAKSPNQAPSTPRSRDAKPACASRPKKQEHFVAPCEVDLEGVFPNWLQSVHTTSSTPGVSNSHGSLGTQGVPLSTPRGRSEAHPEVQHANLISTPRSRQTERPDPVSTPRSRPSTPRSRSEERVAAPCCVVNLDLEGLEAELEAAYSRHDARTPTTTPRGSRQDLHTPMTTPRGSRRDLHTSPVTPRGSRRDLHTSPVTPRGSRRDLHTPPVTPRDNKPPVTPTGGTQNLNLQMPPQMPPSTPRRVQRRNPNPTPTQPHRAPGTPSRRPNPAANTPTQSSAQGTSSNSAVDAAAMQRRAVEQYLFNAGWEPVNPPEQASALRASVMSWLTQQSGSNLKRRLPDKCAICLDGMNIGDCVLKLRCGHSFHKACIQSWLTNSTVCPLCKQCVIPEVN